MAHPAWVADGFAVVLVVVGAYCLARLVAVVPLRRRTHVDVNVGHVLMAVAMVGMLVPGWRTLPIDAWNVVFGLLAAWFLARAGLLAARVGLAAVTGPFGLHVRHYAVHGVMALSMVYMGSLRATSGGQTGGTMAMGAHAGAPAFTLAFTVVLLASAVWQLNGVERRAPVLQPAGAGAVVAAVTDDAPPRPGAGATGEAVAPRPWLAPRLEVACHVAMCLAMAYMLVLVV